MGCSSSLPFFSAIENIFLNRKKKFQNFKKPRETNSENGYIKDSMNGTIKNDNEIGEKIIYDNSISDTKSTELQNIPIKDPNEKIIDETLHELASSTKEETLAEYKDRMKIELTKTISFDKTHTSTDFTEMQSNYSLKTTSTEPEIEQSFQNNNPSNSIDIQHTFSDFQKISSTAVMTKNLLSATAPNESVKTSKNTKQRNFPIYRPRSNRISSKPTKWEQRHDNLSRSGKKLHRRKSSLSIFSDDSTMFKKPHTLYLVFGNNFLKTPKIKIIESQKGSRWMLKPKQNISELNVYTGVKTLIGEEEIPSETVKKPKATPKKTQPESTKLRWNTSSKAVEKPVENNYLHKSTGIERKESPTFDTIPLTNNLNLNGKEQQQDIIQKHWGAARENVNPIQKSQIETASSSTRFISPVENNENDIKIEKLTDNKNETVSVDKPQNSSLNNVRQTSNLSRTNTVSTRGSRAQNSLTNVRKKSAIPFIKPNVVTVKNKNRLQTENTGTTSLTSAVKRTYSNLNSVRQISNLSQANTMSSRGSKIRNSITNIKKKSTGPSMKQNTITTIKNKSPSQNITPTSSRFKKVNTSIPERKISPRPIFNVKIKQTSELNLINQTLIEDEKNVSINSEKQLAPSKGLTIADIVNQTMKRKESNETNSDSIRKEKAKLWLKSIQKNEKTNDNPSEDGEENDNDIISNNEN